MLEGFNGREIILNVTTFTGVCTLLIYAFSYGFYDYFKLPNIYFSLDTNIIVSNGLFLFLLATFFFAPIFFAYKITNVVDNKLFSSKFYIRLRNKTSPQWRKNIFIILVFLTLVLSLIYLILNITFYSFLISLVCSYIFYLFYLRKDSTSHFLAALILLLVLFIWACYYIGNNVAESSTYYSITHLNGQDYVVIKEFKNHYVVAPINFKKRELDPIYHLIPLSKEDVQIRLEEIDSIEIK